MALNQDTLTQLMMNNIKDNMGKNWSNDENKSGHEAMEKLCKSISNAIIEHIKNADITIKPLDLGLIAPSSGGVCISQIVSVKASIE